MKCKNCNMEVQPGTKYCPNCGSEITEVAMNENAVVETPQVNNVNQPVVNNVVAEDKTNVLLVVLSWFIPLVGFILFFTMKKTSPKTAKASGLCALISAIISLVFVIIAFVFVGNLTFKTIEDSRYNIVEKNDDYDDIDDNDEIDDDDDLDEDDTVSGTWSQYQFSVNGKTMTLPVDYNTLATNTGFAFKDTVLTNSLNNNYYTLVNMYKDGKLALYTEITNNTGAAALYKDCKITRVGQTKYQVEQGANVVTFPGNLRVGMSVTDENIKAALGTPNDVDDYNSGSYVKKTYTYLADTSWTTTNYYKIAVVNGVIDELTLDNR